ncbi:hypothetical protein F511_39315 [Dorcoceras hygrometricum]|uniref:Uncharacterized protein n=1 Tax=Dorcoceras hygrometricum TaxID=472368 RepID=A0A2Z7BJG8_9LAMI|nr:hypothetical protein F511_39315 [Dorcoceras hygrometricum]
MHLLVNIICWILVFALLLNPFHCIHLLKSKHSAKAKFVIFVMHLLVNIICWILVFALLLNPFHCIHLLKSKHSAKAKRCRINLFKRHRFAIANSKYHLLVISSCLLIPSSLSAPAELSSSAEHDVVTNDIIIDGPFRCSSWFSFDVPADPSSSSSACSWFISFQLIHFAPAGSTWPPPDFEHLT